MCEKLVLSQLPLNTLAFEFDNDVPWTLLIEKAADENRKLNFYLLSLKLKDIFEDFKSNFTLIDAAGGLIYNKNNELLGIFRRGKWDLPKGKVEENESFEKAAIRECQEETGLISLKIIEKTQVTYHTYFQNSWILKRTHWYKMQLLADEPTNPQTEEDISAIRWFKNNDLSEFYSNTYNSLKEILPTN